MKKLNVLAFVAIFAMGFAYVSCDSKKSVSLKTGIDSVSYLMGASNGIGLKGYLESLPEAGNIDAFINGFIKAAKGDSSLLGMTQIEVQSYVNNYFQQAQTKAAETALAEGKKFLEENKEKEGVITTESGLQYKVITEGTGPKPAIEDTVEVHYVGRLLDGTPPFDNSIERGQPVKFPLNGVIPGWSEGVQLMSKGSKYIIWVPAELGYGMNSPIPAIKPNSTLEFEVELLNIFKSKGGK
ncbi:MAG: FKBP-type peptidyl-prolyl cis-trans isomerase [Tannerella sp.]|jgi:FKBP-type peptidyl-prolyl cis-trans isomerase|nr:FKBP-type peptidyl-prolyl cis-trans isomerase [Tannerella sp.]